MQYSPSYLETLCKSTFEKLTCTQEMLDNPEAMFWRRTKAAEQGPDTLFEWGEYTMVL